VKLPASTKYTENLRRESRSRSSSNNRYAHVQPRISSFRAGDGGSTSRRSVNNSSHKVQKHGQQYQQALTRVNSQQEKKIRIKAPEATRANKPKIPISRIRQKNKDTFVVSRTSVNAANKNFEILKNNFASASRRAA
jgi:hypothetical protein